MNKDKELNTIPDSKKNEVENRRDALRKFGKYSAYIAPFTVLAFAQKASANASVTGPAKHH